MSRSFAAIACGAALVVACFSSSQTTQPPDGGGGSALDSAGLPLPDGATRTDSGSDASAGADASPVADATTPADAGADGTASGEASTDGAVLAPLASCSVPTTIDTAHTVVGNFAPALTLGGGKYAVFWCEGAVGGGGPFSCKARVFDGVMFQPEQSINTLNNTVALLASDGAGNAYAVWSSGRTVLTSATGTFGAVDTTFTVNPVVTSAYSIAPLRAGGAFVAFTRTGSGTASAYTTRYDPTGASWSAPDLREGGAFNSPHIATNASDHAVAAWMAVAGGGTSALSIATFDGSTWSAVTHSTIGTGTAGGGPSDFSLAAYSNGDALIVYRDNNGGVTPAIMSQRYRAATATWDAAATIDSTPGVGGVTRLAIDDADRATALYTNTGGTENRAVVSRDLGSGWTAPQDLGASYDLLMALDPAGDPVVELGPNGSIASVRRCAANAATWSPAVSTGFATPTPNTTERNAIAFDGAGHPVIAAHDTVQSQQVVRVTVCQ